MKKSKIVKWLLLFGGLVIALFIGSHLLHFGGWGHRNMAFWHNGGSQMQAFQGRGFHHGFKEGQFGGPHGMRHFGRGHGIFGFGSILFALAAMIIGWFLRKNAKGNMCKKWGGWLLIGIGALMLMTKVVPLVLFIIIGIVIWKIVSKGKKQPKVESVGVGHSFDAITTVSSKTGNMLDEWERKVSKEEN